MVLGVVAANFLAAEKTVEQWDFWSNAFWSLIATAVGAALAAVFGLWQARRIRALEQRDQAFGILQSLAGEVAVIAELASVDLDLKNLCKKEQANELIHRIQSARNVFEGTACSMGLLSGNLPEQVVRFYSRVSAKTHSMAELVEKAGFFTMRDGVPLDASSHAQFSEHRNLLSLEAEVLLGDLRKALSDIRPTQL